MQFFIIDLIVRAAFTGYIITNIVAMKALQVLLDNGSVKREPLQLFSQLKALKNQDNVRGVTVVDSDNEDED